jgi:NAD(P)H dehydrogenase (quinone)
VNVVVVHAHPSETSYSAALCTAAADGLRSRGHSVRVHELYRDNFAASMSGAERHAYHGDSPIIDPTVARYAADVTWAEALVFVYPTWWMSMPAVMKAWLERVMVPGVAFTFDEAGKVASLLGNVRRVAGVTTYGASRNAVRFASDGGRRTITHALRLSCGWRTRTEWFGLYALDTTTTDERDNFAARVRNELFA